MAHRIVIDALGNSVQVPLTEAEEAKLSGRRAAFDLANAAERQRDATLAAARPGAAIVQKLKDGTTLTAGEMQSVIRWLALRAAREILE